MDLALVTAVACCWLAAAWVYALTGYPLPGLVDK